MKKKWLTAAAILAMVLVLTGVLIGCKKQLSNIPIDGEKLIVYMDNQYTVGLKNANNKAGTIALSAAFNGAKDFVLAKGNNVSISGDVLTAIRAGEAQIACLEGDKPVTKKITVVDGVNVLTESELRKALKEGKNAVLQTDLKTSGKDGMPISSTLYGNGHYIDANSVAANKTVTFSASKVAEIRDLQLYGKKIAEGQSAVLDDFEGYGTLIAAEASDGTYPDLKITHCVIENGQKLVWISSAKVTIEGTILRNGADAIVAVETSARKGSELNLKNNVISNSVVAGILLCGWKKAGASSQATVNIDGFLDIYNWKGTDTTKLMPNTEDMAWLVNPMIETEMKKEIYKAYYYEENGKEFLHVGMIVLATQDLAANSPTINGLDKIGYEMRKFPLPPLAEKVAVNTCNLYGYASKKPGIKPGATIADNGKIYSELIYGRR